MINLRLCLKKLFIIHCAFALISWCIPSPTSASVIDAPHNETQGVKCSDCHAYSLWWQYSPATNSNTSYTQITNDVCNKCHAPGRTAPNKIGHNWESMADTHDTYLGTWDTNCLDCHTPHYQEQLSWLNIDPGLSSELYLVNGTISAGSLQVNSGNNTTTFSYKNVDAHLSWINPALWSEKSLPGRGLILLIKDSQQNTFEINAAIETTPIIPGSANGSGTITVQGSIPISYNTADTEFSLIYGQLLKKTINTPNSGARDVKFFDASISYAEGKTGGTADPVSNPPQGICQVCHTNTKYYNSDGLQPDRDNPTGPRIAASPHNASAPCTGCHSISQGFRPTNADHTFISSAGTTCTSCHNQSDIITDTHRGNCTNCHKGTLPGLIAPFSSPKWPTLSGQTRQTGTCYDCHSPIEAAFTAHPKAFDHLGQVDPHPNCTGCHFHNNKDVVSVIHDSDRDHNGSPDGSPCSTCHNLTYNTNTGAYSGSGALIGRAAQRGPGNCTRCHNEIAVNFFVHPKSNDHTNQVVATPQCANCHDGDPVNDVHSWSCGMCHVPPTGLLKGVALTKGPGDCMNCHTNFFIHTNANALNHSVEVTTSTLCIDCHTSANLITDLHGRNGCNTCHDQFGALVGSAAGHNNGGDCTT
ncbi:MAG: cytochrome c3 family protein, partial [Desulfobulbaceae bacterium]|nr:cytochrome c3 family protein [Desulfobulbaceae bacterium]